jgi:hypothetical protein
MRKSSHCDRVILMTKFVSHQVQNVVRGHPGFMYVNGGLSELSDKLLEISRN